jgi:hypothetical protein
MNIFDYGKYRLGLTDDEIKCYIQSRAQAHTSNKLSISDCDYLYSLLLELGTFTKVYEVDKQLVIDRWEILNTLDTFLPETPE